ncbi:hypothetical protein TRFO_11073 [Tritrichomonas foetus]|uniref:Uncharacterized protein n=1 Tax=Tritrichomonas foetus TaxID=1144522 RepID=A0A1J4J893_9EUKA|nr:hypothetical protein TRFO_11073 [Tritrichomonas foetus]|eukprot:OHS94463.1 hypothetical protein TRFO_11073 [Tritrichomonas foetus]
MKAFNEDDNKDGRYFPNESEMPVLIHYLQVYFSHPERSIQRSQVVQNVASILSPTNKHWNHRTIRLWFNNNKRVFYRPSSPQNQTSVFQEPEPPMTLPPQPKYFMPARSLSVVQMPNVMEPIPEREMSGLYGMPPVNRPLSQWTEQVPQPLQPKQGSFAMQLMQEKESMMANQNSLRAQIEAEARTTEKINSIWEQKWTDIAPIQPVRSTILDPSTTPLQTTKNSFYETVPQLMNPNMNSNMNLQQNYPLNINMNQNLNANINVNMHTSMNQNMHGNMNQNMHTSMNQNMHTSMNQNMHGNMNHQNTQQISRSMCFPQNMNTSNCPVNLPATLSAKLNSAQSMMNQYPATLGVVSFDLIEASTFTKRGDPIVVSYDDSFSAHQIHANNSYINTGFIAPISSTAFDEEAKHIWIHSGNVIKSFTFSQGENNNNFVSSHTIFTGPHRSSLSAMTFWGHNLVLSSKSTVLTWKRDLMYTAENTDDKSIEGVCLNLIVPNITSLTTVDNNLVVASSEYHTAHIVAQNGAIANRAMGHTAGITSLNGYDSNCFLTGSADETGKFWDLRVPIAVYNFTRHRGIVTAIFGDGNDSSSLIFTGGTDGMVRAWDIKNMRVLFSVPIGDAVPQSVFYHHPTKKLTVISSEQTQNCFYDLGKFGSPNDIQRKTDYGPNSIITFQC